MNHKLLAALTVALVGVPGVAWGATAGTEPDGIHIRALPGEVNRLSVAGETFASIGCADAGAPLTAVEGCSAGPPVSCPNVGAVTADLGDRGDVASLNLFTTQTTVDGGPGDDDFLAGGLEATGLGGPRDDTIRLAADGQTHGSGGPGDDRIAAGLGSCYDELRGDPGADLLVVSGGCVLGSLLDGGDGQDRLVVASPVQSAPTVSGGNGSDTLVGPPALPGRDDRHAAVLDGGAGADLILSRAGDATIDGGPGSDLIDAAHGGAPDTITCGGGSDGVYADPDDVVAADCERRTVKPAPDELGLIFGRAIKAADALLAHTPDPATDAAAAA